MGDRAHALALYVQAQHTKEGKGPPNLPPDHAYRLMASAVMADPTMGLGWYEHANANSDNMWRHAAVAAHRRALELPDGEQQSGDLTPEWRLKCMSNLAHNLHHLGKNKEAKAIVMDVLNKDPDSVYGWTTLSLIQNVGGQLEDAEKSARRAYRLAPKDPVVEICLAFALMYGKNYADGLRHFEARFEYILRNFLDYPYPKWDGTPGKVVAIISEQGMGDALSFSRFVPAVIERSKHVHIRVNAELLKLLKIMFQKYDNVTIEPQPCPYPPAEVWTTYMSLPVALGLSTKEIIEQPDLPFPKMPLDFSWRSPDRDMHIGVTWTGSKANWINHWRSFPVERLLDFYRVPGIQLYSLQVDEAADQIHANGLPALIKDMRPYIRDVCDTMQIVRGLDLVITCESALGHICGFMGKECWIPYSYNGGDFRIGRTEEGSLWYPNHKIFKQDYEADWQPVFDRITRALQRRQRGIIATDRKARGI